MNLRVGARTDVGRVREGNEDSYMVHEPLYAVADGMGGHQGGEVASKLALETLGRLALEDSRDTAPNLADAVREANRAVLDKASTDPGLHGMGTTLTAVVAGGNRVFLAHVGDSRAYLLRDGHMDQLTEDHTVVEGLVREGRLTRQEAEIHPQRSILTRALGVDGEVEVEEKSQDVREGDRILLCSDGLTGMVPEQEIERILAELEDPQRAAEALVDAANDAGGQDNITAVVLDVLPETEAVDTAPVAPAESHAAESEARGAEAPRGRRRWARRVILWVLIPLVLVVGALAALKLLFIDRQWYVGVEDGQVAIFRGIPAEPLGIPLDSVVRQTEIPADEISRFADYQGIDEGITAQSRDEAESIVAEMQRVLAEAEARERQQQRDQDGGGGGGSGGGGGGNP
jgi:serine/threonine protein phosphatase PrpC